ncbi:MAG: hypothetical protein PWP07_18 [Epulopiscium sp.]|nr:hypothetical protein [Candidatus Epulonipiscium sp.]
MRLVPVECLNGGEIIAKTIIDKDGSRLLAKNTSFKLYYKEKLLERGIDKIYIVDDLSEGIENKDVISEQVRLETIDLVKDMVSLFKATQQIDVHRLEDTAVRIIEEILNNKEILYDIVDIKAKDNYTYCHSVNVAVLCVMLGRKMGGNKSYLKKLAIGGLLHDFGKILVPDEVLNMPVKLSNQEYNLIKQHPLQGYHIFKEHPSLTPITKAMILMHHEQIGGKGYPLGLTGEKIPEAAKICAICDIFDAMTSKRIHRDPYTIIDTLNEMEKMTRYHLDSDIFKIFRSIICYYPVGTTVLLSDDTIAIVEKNKTEAINQPTVRVIYDLKSQQELFKRLDLVLHDDIKIQRELVPDEYMNNPAILRAMKK